MADLIERYVYEVCRRLPEPEREEVRRELTTNIYDMLSDYPSEAEIADVLNSLGSPRLLADRYRQKQNYLISPAIYYDYMRALKLIVPLVGTILLVLGMVMGAIESIQDGMVNVWVFMLSSLGKGLSMCFSGVLQALFWTTVTFLIVDRTAVNRDFQDRLWTVDNLPEQIELDKSKSSIPLSESIMELVLSVVFTLVFIMLLTGSIPFAFVYSNDSLQGTELFAHAFVVALIPVMAISCVIKVAEDIVKITQRRWNFAVCLTVLISNVLAVGLLVFLVLQPQILDPDFMAFVSAQPWWTELAMSLSFLKMGVGIDRMLLVVLVAAVILGILVSSVAAIIKTVRANLEVSL